MTNSIKPSHAVTIWSDKEILYVELPQASGQIGQAHILKLPLNIFGLTQCINLLKARSDASRIGERGDPTQFQADKEIQEMSKKAAGYKGPITKEAKVSLTPERRDTVREMIRRFINV